jgi:hypothetical protein
MARPSSSSSADIRSVSARGRWGALASRQRAPGEIRRDARPAPPDSLTRPVQPDTEETPARLPSPEPARSRKGVAAVSRLESPRASPALTGYLIENARWGSRHAVGPAISSRWLWLADLFPHARPRQPRAVWPAPYERKPLSAPRPRARIPLRCRRYKFATFLLTPARGARGLKGERGGA